VVLVTALDGRQDRIHGLDAGADEFLTKPIDDIVLFSRVRSLTRLKLVIDELRQREASGRRMGVIEGAAQRLAGGGGRVLVVDDQERQAQRIVTELTAEHRPIWEPDPEKAHLTARGPVDLVIINAVARGFDGCASPRSCARTRRPVMCPSSPVLDPDDRPRMVKALDIGVNDVLSRPIDPQELSAARAPRSSASATPTTCATTSTSRLSWPSPTSSRACTTAATWPASSARWSAARPRAASRSPP
jgi:two-component system cell cycle response regulator